MSEDITIRICSAKSSDLRNGEMRLCPPLSVRTNPEAMEFPAIPPKDQQRLLNRVLDILAGMAITNKNQDWWYLPISEVQPNMSAILPILETEAHIKALLKSGVKGRFLLMINDSMIAHYLLSLMESIPGLEVVASTADRLRWGFDRAKNPVRRLLNTILWGREHLQKISDITLRQFPKSVHTLFVSRFEADLENPDKGFHKSPWSDRYLGELVEQGFQKTNDVLLMGRCGGDAQAIGNMAKNYERFGVCTVHQLLGKIDILNCLWRAWKLRLACSSTDPLARILMAESRNHVRAVADCILVELAVKNLLVQTTPKQIVCMQENSVWEHAVVRASREKSPNARLIGYFHCPVMASAIRYHTRSDLSLRPIFDTIVPLGDAMAESLCKLGPWQSKLVPGYGFRNPDIFESLSLTAHEPQSPFRLVILLGGMFDNAIFLKWVNEARMHLSDTHLLIKGHPVYGSHAALGGAGIDLSAAEDIEDITSLSMIETLQQADCVIYKGTTAGLSALAAGVPVIHVDHGGIQTDDTLFAAGHLVKSVANKKEFENAIGQIRARTVIERKGWIDQAKQYAENYYDISEARRDQVLGFFFSNHSSFTDKK